MNNICGVSKLGKTIVEKILSKKSGIDAHANEIVIADLDFVVGQDGTSSAPPVMLKILSEGGLVERFKKYGTFNFD